MTKLAERAWTVRDSVITKTVRVRDLTWLIEQEAGKIPSGGEDFTSDYPKSALKESEPKAKRLAEAVVLLEEALLVVKAVEK